MTLGAIKALYIKHMGEYSNDADDPSVMAQYMPEALAYINEGYAVVMKRYNPPTIPFWRTTQRRAVCPRSRGKWSGRIILWRSSKPGCIR